MKYDLTYEEAESLLERYPAFTYAAWCMYRTTNDTTERDRLRARIAANIGSNDDLRELLGADSQPLINFYPDILPPRLSTEDTISTFIDKFTPSAPPVSDYLASIEQLDPLTPAAASNTAKASETSDISGQSEPRDATEISESEEVVKPSDPPIEKREPSPLTESFARIMIKNRNYKKALEIITELNLKNSEKSIYFADQIRFLKKLIALESAAKSAKK